MSKIHLDPQPQIDTPPRRNLALRSFFLEQSSKFKNKKFIPFDEAIVVEGR